MAYWRFALWLVHYVIFRGLRFGLVRYGLLHYGETTTINNTAFLIPTETDSAARTHAAPASFSKTFWAVPQVEKWIGPLAP
jgi:hypothetical protein